MTGTVHRLILCLLGVMLSLVFVPAHAMGETGGHFLSGVEEPTVKGTENATHFTELTVPGLAGMVCEEASYEATPPKSASRTWSEVTVTPKYGKCKTTGGTAGETVVHVNGCAYVLKIGKAANQDNTVDLECKGEKSYLVVTHQGCEIRVPAQSGLKGLAYTGTVENGKAALTLDITVTSLTTHFEMGFCVLLGTTKTTNLTGSVTAAGSSSGSPVAISAVGSEGPRFQSEVTHWSVTGTATGTGTYTFGELVGPVECATASFDGTSAVQATTTLTIKPAFSECEGVKGRVVTPHMNGCAYILRLTGEGADGLVSIECPAEAAIETTVDKFPEGGCTLTIGSQTPNGVVDYEEEGEGTGRKLSLTWTLTGVKYTRDGCEIGGEGNNGTISGTATIEGEDTSGNPKGIWIE
jgi:hypothetical protein